MFKFIFTDKFSNGILEDYYNEMAREGKILTGIKFLHFHKFEEKEPKDIKYKHYLYCTSYKDSSSSEKINTIKYIAENDDNLDYISHNANYVLLAGDVSPVSQYLKSDMENREFLYKSSSPFTVRKILWLLLSFLAIVINVSAYRSDLKLYTQYPDLLPAEVLITKGVEAYVLENNIIRLSGIFSLFIAFGINHFTDYLFYRKNKNITDPSTEIHYLNPKINVFWGLILILFLIGLLYYI